MLPKLSITKFDGTFEPWLPFWNKFSAEIDSTDDQICLTEGTHPTKGTGRY